MFFTQLFFDVPRDALLSESPSLSPDKTGGLRPRHFQPMEDNPMGNNRRSQPNGALLIGPTTCQYQAGAYTSSASLNQDDKNS
ncbi:hypothetical protein JTE90_009990 [Oedothorax gibbosus]|uniref:Uncharacterized protein n=1 Tax=Oedothorax gibbosus TaxID=931172 RepID=A0AAV6UEH1_9ARAC|nr:hypothetical protein JTE90_009990 [Oedothorax gibbosus]